MFVFGFGYNGAPQQVTLDLPVKLHKTCGKCNKKNHLTQFCRTKHIKQIDKTEETSSECEDDNQYAFTATNVCKEEKRPTTDIKLCSTKINILVDTGASVNLIDGTTYNTLEKIPQHNSKKATQKYSHMVV